MEDYEADPYVGVTLKRIAGKYDMLVWGDASRFELKKNINFEKYKTAEIHAALRELGFRRKGDATGSASAGGAAGAAEEDDEDDEDVPDVGNDEL